MNLRLLGASSALILSLSLIGNAPAALVTTAPSSGSTTVFAGGTDCNSGPSTGTVSGFPVSANGDACYNYDDGWGLGANGHWNISLIGDNSAVTLITIDLGGLFGSVGGFMNYAPNDGTPMIAALDASLNVLESYDLSSVAPISTTANDDGAFRGISRTGNDIRYFRFGGSYSAMHYITLDSSSVPVTSTLLLLAPMLALGALRRRRG
jgi:hypothetical protein